MVFPAAKPIVAPWFWTERAGFGLEPPRGEPFSILGGAFNVHLRCRFFLEAANFSPQGERVPLTSGQPAAFRDGIVLLNFRLGSLFGESLNRYRSELVGLDPGPTPWTRSSQREVGPLPPGEYLFRVWAEDAWGGVSGPAVLRWTVAPHFRESLPAKLGFGLLLGLLVFVGVRVRHAQLRKRQVELKEAVQRLTEALHRENQRLSDLSYLDPLTGIPNRRRFEERLEEEWRRGERSQLPLSLVILDIDAFQRFNDSHGHLAGDEALIRVAAALKLEVSRVSDVVARLGGEEFVILLPGTSLDGAERVAERVLLRVRQLGIEHQDQPNPGWLTVSCGVASRIPSRRHKPSALIAAADQALYRAKAAGGNRVIAETPQRRPPSAETAKSSGPTAEKQDPGTDTVKTNSWSQPKQRN